VRCTYLDIATKPWLISAHRPIVFEHISALLSASTQYSILLIERVVVGLLRLCLILVSTARVFYTLFGSTMLTAMPQPSLRDQLYVSFDLLSCLPPEIANAVGEQIVRGVSLIVREHQDIIQSEILPRNPRDTFLMSSF
jgi:brefeldin A-resistance guanine nucleotide exchange factor 1